MNAKDVLRFLYYKCALKGLSGVRNDVRLLEASKEAEVNGPPHLVAFFLERLRPLLAQGRHELVHRTCPPLTQSGHAIAPFRLAS